MTRASISQSVSIEDAIRREVQDRLDRQIKVLGQAFRICVLGLRSEGAMFVIPVAPDSPGASEEAVRVLAASVENDMEEDHPGLRLMLLPEFGKRSRAWKARRGSKPAVSRVPSKRKGR